MYMYTLLIVYIFYIIIIYKTQVEIVFSYSIPGLISLDGLCFMPEAITADGKSQRPPDRERHGVAAEIASGARRGSRTLKHMGKFWNIHVA